LIEFLVSLAVRTSTATRDLTLIQQNKFYWISNGHLFTLLPSC